MDAETSFNHEIDNNPRSGDANTIKIYASIVGIVGPILRCPTYPVLSRIYKLVREGCGEGNEVLNAFLIDAGIDTKVLLDLYLYIDEIRLLSRQYTPNCAMSVWMTIDPTSQDDEAVQVLFDETNIGFRPACKLAVMSLERKIYNKTGSKCDTCTICLEECESGDSVVTLACGHLFDDKCITDWFSTSHVCPLCRFKLPREI